MIVSLFSESHNKGSDWIGMVVELKVQFYQENYQDLFDAYITLSAQLPLSSQSLPLFFPLTCSISHIGILQMLHEYSLLKLAQIIKKKTILKISLNFKVA